MSNEVSLRHASPTTALVISDTQTAFTTQQITMLEHIGVDRATPADLDVFFHQCKRTGLDPFLKQIYMIGRENSENINGQWVKKVKQTIQTGIDGYRLIGRRAAAASGESISVKPPQWAHPEGGWRDVWTAAWGTPVAARVVIERNGQTFTATALFDEYKQTKRDGNLTKMWEQRPAGQIAKCAEALAWRMAFPQDLSGIYTDEEMGQANNSEPTAPVAAAPVSALQRLRPAPEPAADADGAVDEAPALVTNEQLDLLAEALTQAGHETPEGKLFALSELVGHDVANPRQLTYPEAVKILDELVGVVR